MTTLKAVTTKIGSGATPRGGASVYVDEGAAFIRSQNVLDLCFSNEGLARIGEDAAEGLRNVAVEPGDVLVNITGDSVARVALWPRNEPARVSQHVAIVRCDPAQVDARYMQYWLHAPAQKAQLLTLSAAGASRPALTKGMLEAFPFGPHPLAEQKAIAEVLGALDDKIAANRQVIAAADRLVESLVVSRLSQRRPLWGSIDFVFGEAFKGSEFSEPGFGRPLIRIRDLKSQRCQVWTTETRARERVVAPGEVLVGMDAEFRATRWSGPQGVLNQRVLLAESDKFGPAIVRHALAAPLAQIERSKTGTTVIHLNKSDLMSVEVSLPADGNVMELRSIADPMWLRMVAGERENETLAKTRDELLPLLMSGKITVRDAEKRVEGVV